GVGGQRGWAKRRSFHRRRLAQPVFSTTPKNQRVQDEFTPKEAERVMATGLYVRCSHTDQTTASQEGDLERWANAQDPAEEIRWYRDVGKTGTNFNRPGWQALEADVEAGNVKRIVLWRLDRLGRAAGETITIMDRFDASGVTLVSLRDGFDSQTASGRLMRNM